MTLQLSVRTHPGRVVLCWLHAGWKAGLLLGAAYGLALGALSGGYLIQGLTFGAAAGLPLGVGAGLVNGVFLGLLARPLGLNSGSNAARARAAAVAVTVTWLVLLPVLLAGIRYSISLAAVLPPIAASALAAGGVALRIPPAGRPANPNAFVQIETR